MLFRSASIDALEYINEQNIAITVQVADKTYDPVKRKGVNSSYVIYWLNPQTMKVRSNAMWQVNNPLQMGNKVCYAGRSIPHLGTLATETIVSGLQLVKTITGGVVYAPAMISFWRSGGVCLQRSIGHSILEKCGETYLNFDDFFDSMELTSSVFWGILTWLGDFISKEDAVEISPVSDLLRGFDIYGHNTIGILGLKDGTMTLANTPFATEMTSVYAFVRQIGRAHV